MVAFEVKAIAISQRLQVGFDFLFGAVDGLGPMHVISCDIRLPQGPGKRGG